MLGKALFSTMVTTLAHNSLCAAFVPLSVPKRHHCFSIWRHCSSLSQAATLRARLQPP